MKTLGYAQLFHKEEDRRKLDAVLDILGRENCFSFCWLLDGEEDDALGDIRPRSLFFRYSKEKSPVKYVEVFYNIKCGDFYITNSVTGTGIYQETPEAAAAAVISYADSFTQGDNHVG